MKQTRKLCSFVLEGKLKLVSRSGTWAMSMEGGRAFSKKKRRQNEEFGKSGLTCLEQEVTRLGTWLTSIQNGSNPELNQDVTGVASILDICTIPLTIKMFKYPLSLSSFGFLLTLLFPVFHLSEGKLKSKLKRKLKLESMWKLVVKKNCQH